MSHAEFKEALQEAGVPTTEAELKKAWEKEVAVQGSKLSNTGAYSPFWRIVTALVTKPVLWLIEFLIEMVLPNLFVKTAGGIWLDRLAWAVNVDRKRATKAQGGLLFTRDSLVGSLDVEAGTRVQSVEISGRFCELVTTQVGTFVDGESQLSITVEATEAGSRYNLAPGFYSIFPVPVPGIVRVSNERNWLTRPGDDPEPDEQLRLRARNQFSAVNQHHTDAVYRSIISSFSGVRPDGIFFEHGTERGPGSANAFVLFEAHVPANHYLKRINNHIREQRNHGHGDDLLVRAMPETQHEIKVSLWPMSHLVDAQCEILKTQVEQFVRTAFRETTKNGYRPTLTSPQSRFSFSRLSEELHKQFPWLESLKFTSTDIISELSIPRIKKLDVTLEKQI